MWTYSAAVTVSNNTSGPTARANLARSSTELARYV